MRILLITTIFPPYKAGPAVRAYSFARYWARAGADVSVLTTAKHADQQGFDVPFAGFSVTQLAFEPPRLLSRLRGQEKTSAEAGDPSPSTAFWLDWLRSLRQRRGIYNLVRMPDLSDFWVRPARAWARSNGPWDMVVSSSGPYTPHLVALALRREGRTRAWVADFRDLWTEHPSFPGLFPFTLLERHLERSCFRHVDATTSVSEPLVHRLAAVTGKPSWVTYNGFDPELAAMVSDEPAFPKDGVVRLAYTGALYTPGRDPAPLLLAMAELDQETDNLGQRLSLVVVGPQPNEWQRLAETHNVQHLLDNRGYVHPVESWRIQRDADALVFLDWHRPDDGILTSKIFDYLIARAPILAIGAAPESPLGDLIRRSRRGTHLGNSPAAIRETLKRLLNEGADCIEAAGEPEVIAGFTRESQALQLLARLEQTLKER